MALVGWQGITVRVPDDWEPGQFSGDYTSGHMRLDSLEGPRLVVRWMGSDEVKDLYRREPSRDSAVERIVQNYLKKLEKTERKRKNEISYNPNTRLLSKRQTGKKAMRCYSWECRPDRRYGQGLVWYCEECQRTIIAEVTGKSKRQTEHEARQVLATLRDHPENGLAVWAFFGMHFEVPERFKLTGSTTMVGRIELRFRDGSERVALQRWVANVVLEGRAFDDWVRRQIMGPMRQEFRVRLKKGTIHGHPGALLEGRKRRIHDTLIHIVTRLARRKTAYFLRGRVWHCEPSNKIFSVLTCTTEDNTNLADEITQSAVCHGEGAGSDGR